MPEATSTEAVVKEVRIVARPETIFPFFTEPERLTRWLCESATVDPRPGGAIHQTHRDHEGTAHEMRGEYVEVTPPTRVVFTWGFEGSPTPPGSSTVEVTLERDGEATLVRLVHRDLSPAERDDHAAGWPGVLARLVAAVEG